MIYVALGPALDTRFSTLALKARGGEPLGKTPYHEAFHAVQDWLEQMAMRSNNGAADMFLALHTDEALAEMTELIKKDKFGNYQPNMAPAEVQAEAFAVWYNNRKIRLKTGGLQAAFERIKKFINTLRRNGDMRWIETRAMWTSLSWRQKARLLDQGNRMISKLTPQQLEGLKGRIWIGTWIRCSRCSLIESTTTSSKSKLTSIY